MNKIRGWIEKRYASLRSKIRGTPFRFDDAARLLHERHQDAEDQVNVILSELRKAGLLAVNFDPVDARKRVYQLKGLDELLSTQVQTTNLLTRGELDSLLKRAADLIRTRVDYTFILILSLLQENQ